MMEKARATVTHRTRDTGIPAHPEGTKTLAKELRDDNLPLGWVERPKKLTGDGVGDNAPADPSGAGKGN